MWGGHGAGDITTEAQRTQRIQNSEYRIQKSERSQLRTPNSELRTPVNDERRTVTASNRAAEFFETIHPFLDHIQTSGIAETNSSIIAKRDTGNDRYVRLAQEAVREILRGEPKPADVDKNIKRTLRADNADMFHLGEAIQHILAAEIKFIPHIDHRLLVSLKSCDGPLLR